MDGVNIKSFNIEEDLFRIKHVKEKVYNKMDKTHFHNNYEVYYFLGGEKLFFINDKLYKCEKGDMIIISPHDLHRTSSIQSKDAERIIINFKYKFIENLIKMESISNIFIQRDYNRIRFTVKGQIEIERNLHEIIKECETKEYNFKACIKALLFMLLLKIDRYSINVNEAEEESHNPMEQNVLNIAKYITNNFDKDISLNSIAKEFYISPSYLSRSFKKITAFHMSEYIQIVRIREAQKLLRETKYKVIEVAEMVGFKQIAHFNKTFKKITDTTPLKYKKSTR